MQESDRHLFSAWTWSLVNQTNALFVTLCQCVCNTVLNSECHVVNTSTTLFQELSDSALRACWLKEFNLHFAHLQESSLHLLVCHFLNSIALQTENVLIIRENLFNALDSNAQMVNTRNLHTDKINLNCYLIGNKFIDTINWQLIIANRPFSLQSYRNKSAKRNENKKNEKTYAFFIQTTHSHTN